MGKFVVKIDVSPSHGVQFSFSKTEMNAKGNEEMVIPALVLGDNEQAVSFVLVQKTRLTSRNLGKTN